MHHDDPILQKCRALLQGLYGKRLQGVVRYGSCARGTEEPESDIDLMVLLAGPVDLAQDIRRLWAGLYPLQLEYEHITTVENTVWPELRETGYELFDHTGPGTAPSGPLCHHAAGRARRRRHYA